MLCPSTDTRRCTSASRKDPALLCLEAGLVACAFAQCTDGDLHKEVQALREEIDAKIRELEETWLMFRRADEQARPHQRCCQERPSDHRGLQSLSSSYFLAEALVMGDASCEGYGQPSSREQTNKHNRFFDWMFHFTVRSL